MTARKPLTLRQQFARKRARETELRFPLGDEGERAEAALAEAQSALQVARIVSKDSAAVEQAKQWAADAEKAWHAASFPMRFRGLSEDERDAIASHHTVPDLPKNPEPTPEQQAAHDDAEHEANRAWTYEALAVCVVNSDLTADEWKAELGSGRWSAGDVESLRQAILTAYSSRPAPGIPKG